LRHGRRIFDISSTYDHDDVAAAQMHDDFVASFSAR
jgi:hypothetical protein